jgi:GAF domain-containing protein
MEPIPETLEAVLLLNVFGEGDLGLALGKLGRNAQGIVPSLVGLSLTRVEEDLTFTLVASGDAVSELDVVQYVDDGPCVEANRTGQTVEADRDDLLEEGRWHLFAMAEAAAGVASSLSLPILRDGRVVGGINLYAALPGAFEGLHRQLAEAVGAIASGAISNADLSFRTRAQAEAAPDKIRTWYVVHHAEGALAEMHQIDLDGAAELLREAAARANISPKQAAAAFVRLIRPQR